ncbi:hypothetical protein A2Z67_00090 [Candidatus Woesebacteria bacterium RBG_13_36_22]|uniref:Uncharacterized protein n=1 Tax=Candidatus Woesebacteria bacterium RBG_13_36_22 TaxID=1802478 RepID=A0A1F7X6D6_9BACT|nr:MAG: hypothetical protein A2Z67_00090 [Candidatus Woesebacteria bacterium RBG_13_36_22]
MSLEPLGVEQPIYTKIGWMGSDFGVDFEIDTNFGITQDVDAYGNIHVSPPGLVTNRIKCGRFVIQRFVSIKDKKYEIIESDLVNGNMCIGIHMGANIIWYFNCICSQYFAIFNKSAIIIGEKAVWISNKHHVTFPSESFFEESFVWVDPDAAITTVIPADNGEKLRIKNVGRPTKRIKEEQRWGRLIIVGD